MTELDPRDPAAPLSPPPLPPKPEADPLQYAQAARQKIADANRQAMLEAEAWADSHVMPWKTHR
jgi:hypothetical protein